MNLYAYVGNDPVNFVDSTGLEGNCVKTSEEWTFVETGRDGSILSVFRTNLNTGPEICFGEDGGQGRGGVSQYIARFTNDLDTPGANIPIALQLDDRCAPSTTPYRTGRQTFFVNPNQLQSVAQAKFLQHMFGYNWDTHRAQSSFAYRDGIIRSGEHLAAGVFTLMNTHIAVEASGGGVRITGSLGGLVGWDERSFDMTTYLTAIFSPPVGPPNQQGLVERRLISAYPGCP